MLEGPGLNSAGDFDPEDVSAGQVNAGQVNAGLRR